MEPEGQSAAGQQGVLPPQPRPGSVQRTGRRARLRTPPAPTGQAGRATTRARPRARCGRASGSVLRACGDPSQAGYHGSTWGFPEHCRCATPLPARVNPHRPRGQGTPEHVSFAPLSFGSMPRPQSMCAARRQGIYKTSSTAGSVGAQPAHWGARRAGICYGSNDAGGAPGLGHRRQGVGPRRGE